MHNKRGVEIAINYIVMMVLGLATLALGFVIVKAFVTGGDESITLTSEQLNAKVATLLCSSNDVMCFSDNNQRIHRNEYAFVGLHIKNIQAQDVTLTIEVSEGKFYPADGSASVGIPAEGVSIVPGTYTLAIAGKETGKMGFGLYASRGAEKGTYSYLITVTDSGAGVFQTRKDRITVQVI